MKFKVILALMTFIFSVLQTSGQNTCQTCMASNEAYCINETSYYLCFGDKPLLTTKSQCHNGHVCTDSLNICEPKDNDENKAVCSSPCGKCPESTAVNKLYTCVSRTQFGRCVSGSITMTGQCEYGQICSSELYNKTGIICSPECVTKFNGLSATCDSDDIITTTTTKPPPINPGNIKQKCKDALPSDPKVTVFSIPNPYDNDCTTYILCEKFGNDVEGLIVKCASSTYFDPVTKRCGTNKPSVCNPSLTTTEPTTTEPTTTAPTTTAPTTTAPTTTAPTTTAPITTAPTTTAPTTTAPTTTAPTTTAPITTAPTTTAPTTTAPTTTAPTTTRPTTTAPTTTRPTTTAPTTTRPTTTKPTTTRPTTTAPTTTAPTTTAPTTTAPTTTAPITTAPTTTAPTTTAPTTTAPTTTAPTTTAPTTTAPTTTAPTTTAPTTTAPTTTRPTTTAPTTTAQSNE